MRQRRWIILLSLLLLAAACRNKERQLEADSLLDKAEASPVDVTNTLPMAVTDTHRSDLNPQFRQLQEDTAAVTNLRIVARKQRVIYSPALLVGEWQRDNEHEQFIADGKGTRWDTGDDVNRAEAQLFTWTMDSNLLTLRFDLALGGLLFRQYVVTFVDEETLVYNDAYGGSFMFDKVPAGFTDRP